MDKIKYQWPYSREEKLDRCGHGPPLESDEINDFKDFLLGLFKKRIPGHRKVFEIIYYLQETMGLIEDKFEQCISCGLIINVEQGGHIEEKEPYRTFCDECAWKSKELRKREGP